MGQRNSTKTRVVPVFDKLLSNDSTGKAWLPRLLSLPGAWRPSHEDKESAFVIQEHKWGAPEQALKPPLALLAWLIRNPRAPISGVLSRDADKAKIRQEWINGSDARISEALSLLSHNPNNLDWHIFEGATYPDVYIKTEKFLVVIEGKRTESDVTTTTKWMPCRHQMLRHLDCAWEVKGNREVLGFFIVESHVGASVPPDWCARASRTTNFDVVRSSLPHRSPEEQWAIARSFIGITTWQEICHEFTDLGLCAEALPDTVT